MNGKSQGALRALTLTLALASAIACGSAASTDGASFGPGPGGNNGPAAATTKNDASLVLIPQNGIGPTVERGCRLAHKHPATERRSQQQENKERSS